MDTQHKNKKQNEEQELVENDQKEKTIERERDENQRKIEELEQQVKRYLADYQNLQRRVQEEKYQWVRSANKELLLKLLPVFDTLLLAVKHIQDKGLELSIEQFLKFLEQEGVTRIKTVGEKFDPNVMEAVTTQKVDGKKDKIVEEVRTGFMLYDQVLRTAQVIVGE